MQQYITGVSRLPLLFFTSYDKICGTMEEKHMQHLLDALPFTAIERFDPFLKTYKQSFMRYSNAFLTGNKVADRHHILKQEHTFRVVAHAWQITAEQRDVRARRVALTAALFHDVGRFEQFSRFGTFADALSVNHGVLGAQVLRKELFLTNESPDFQRQVHTAVLLHNRRKVPVGLEPVALYALNVVRDADKLDIARIMAQFLGVGCVPDETILLHLKDEPTSLSPAFSHFEEHSQSLEYNAMRYLNDFRVLVISWLGQMHFSQSREIALREGYMHIIAEGLEGVPKAREKACLFLAEHDKKLRTQ